jgi:hypothetical protein
MLVIFDNAKLAGFKTTINGGCTQGDGQFFFYWKAIILNLKKP